MTPIAARYVTTLNVPEKTAPPSGSLHINRQFSSEFCRHSFGVGLYEGHASATKLYFNSQSHSMDHLYSRHVHGSMRSRQQDHRQTAAAAAAYQLSQPL